ncbi:MAG: hypothetical protein ACK4RV_07055 [Caulobacter sp.]
MRSRFLFFVPSQLEAEAALDVVLPGQRDPWLLCDEAGDPIGYFSIYSDPNNAWSVSPPPDGNDDPNRPYIQADICGRHFGDEVTVALKQLQAMIGGVVQDDFDQVL